MTWYFVGEIGKYVPGGIWPVVGRAELARRGGHPRSAAYASVALSLGALYLADMLLVAALLPLRFLDEGNDALWLLVLLPIGLLLLHHRPLGWMVELAERAMKRKLTVTIPPWSASLGLVLRYLPAWLLIGTATWCMARAFDPGADWLTIAPAAMFSWVVGFLLVPGARRGRRPRGGVRRAGRRQRPRRHPRHGRGGRPARVHARRCRRGAHRRCRGPPVGLRRRPAPTCSRSSRPKPDPRRCPWCARLGPGPGHASAPPASSTASGCGSW